MKKWLLLFLGLVEGATADAVVVGQTIISGSIDKDIIRTVVRKALPAVRFCYEKQLITQPELTGEITVHFSVNQKGFVNWAYAEESNLPPAVDSCVTKIFIGLRFPAVEKGSGSKVEVHYPISFQLLK